MLQADITEKVIGAFYDVYNELGYGFLEKVYENALAMALRSTELDIRQQAPISVTFRGTTVGEYFADLLVENCVIVEIKAAEKLSPSHEAQLLNYLKATRVEVGLLVNFGPSPDFKRRVLMS